MRLVDIVNWLMSILLGLVSYILYLNYGIASQGSLILGWFGGMAHICLIVYFTRNSHV